MKGQKFFSLLLALCLVVSLGACNQKSEQDKKFDELTRKDSDFFFLTRREAQSAQELVVSLCGERLPRSYGYSPLEDIQVLCPSRKGELGTVELNRLMREAVNPRQRTSRR